MSTQVHSPLSLSSPFPTTSICMSLLTEKVSVRLYPPRTSQWSCRFSWCAAGTSSCFLPGSPGEHQGAGFGWEPQVSHHLLRLAEERFSLLDWSLNSFILLEQDLPSRFLLLHWLTCLTVVNLLSFVLLTLCFTWTLLVLLPSAWRPI